ncbi:TPA: hypothetical protein ACH3X1_016820 [Trebouxia sp. C0004]
MESIGTDVSTNLSTSLTSSVPKNRGGAPPSFIWRFFTKLQQNNKKTNRYPAQCKFCSHVVEDGRVENLHKHILYVCQIASSDIKQYVQAELDKKVSYEGRTGKNKKQKREQGQTPPASRAPAARPINDKEQEELDVKLLRLLIMNSLPFDAVESPWMLDFCHSLKPSYVPAGASKLQTTVLTQEYLKSRAAFTARLAQEHNLSVSIDLWRSNSNQPVYACKVAFSDGSVFLLGAKELPGAAGTAEDVAGIVKEWLKMLGPEKVGSLSTDEIGTLTEARHLVVSTPGFTHIVDFRCPVHALVLAVLAMLASEPVNALICNAHMMASRFHASSAASAFLADEAKELGINAELLPCNLSQVQSVHECLQSLVQMEHAIKQMLQKHPDFPMNQAVTECANSVSFWSQIAKFCKLLAPITDVVKGNMSKTSSLADVMLHWLHLARSLQAAETEANLPHGELLDGSAFQHP